MRKVLSILMVCAILSSSLFTVTADTVENHENKMSQITIDESDGNYEQYLSQFKDLSNANSNIEVFTSKGNNILLTKENASATFEIDVAETAFYQPEFTYKAIAGNGTNIKLGLKIDGKSPMELFDNFELKRAWIDDESGSSVDELGNEFSPEQKEIFIEQTSGIFDINGFYNQELKLALQQGKHTVEVFITNQSVELINITFKTPDVIKSYEEVKNEYIQNNYENYSGEAIVIEGEDAKIKSSSMIIPLVDRNSPNVQPNNPYLDTVNIIGGSNWKDNGDTITWEVNIEDGKAGLYDLNFHFKQTYLQESSSYRTLLIDGKCPFEEARNIEFKYASGWQYCGITEQNNTPIYLSEGKHTISLRVTLGELSQFANELKTVVSKTGDIYRDIVMITGETPDANRDYNLFVQLPNLEEDLIEISTKLDELAKESEEIAGAKGGSNSSILKQLKNTIDKMLSTKYKAHKNIKNFYNNYSSVASWLYEMQDMALDIDAMFLTAPGEDCSRDVSWFSTILYAIKRLFSSFAEDYNSTASEKDEVVIWCNWGRDQINVLTGLINSTFTNDTGIKVNIKNTTANIIQANLAGNGPDLILNQSRSAPVNYAIRNAAYDISKFDDYEEIISRFTDTAMIPYQYNGGVYGLPETQSFYMMFVRTDVFEDLGLEIPKTWEDFILCSKVLYLNNMQVALPYTQVTNDAVNAGVGALTLLPTISVQHNVSLYNTERTKTNFDTKEMLGAATIWTDFYTKYNFPKTYNFFNRFRTGTIPLAIQDYTAYATVSAAAPEIDGNWGMYQIPGIKDAEGNIINTVSGSGNASVILENAKNKESAWEFLKWYSSDDIQYRFSKNLESVMGVSARRAPSNMKAMEKLGWDDRTLNELITQRNKIVEIPEIPGSYYVSRSIDQIYWNVVDGGQDVQTMLTKWGTEADKEIKRKIEEYPVN